MKKAHASAHQSSSLPSATPPHLLPFQPLSHELPQPLPASRSPFQRSQCEVVKSLGAFVAQAQGVEGLQVMQVRLRVEAEQALPSSAAAMHGACSKLAHLPRGQPLTRA
eukprot:6201423-Pleurochrysis_carterae.AAC.2